MRVARAGTILFTGGGLALEPYPEWCSLAAGKAALRAYSLALHKEALTFGVHVAVIAVCGIIQRGGLFDPERIAELYWTLHAEGSGAFSREVVYLREGAEAYYNDPSGAHRSSSDPIVASWR